MQEQNEQEVIIHVDDTELEDLDTNKDVILSTPLKNNYQEEQFIHTHSLKLTHTIQEATKRSELPHGILYILENSKKSRNETIEKSIPYITLDKAQNALAIAESDVRRLRESFAYELGLLADQAAAIENVLQTEIQMLKSKVSLTIIEKNNLLEENKKTCLKLQEIEAVVKQKDIVICTLEKEKSFLDLSTLQVTNESCFKLQQADIEIQELRHEITELKKKIEELLSKSNTSDETTISTKSVFDSSNYLTLETVSKSEHVKEHNDFLVQNAQVMEKQVNEHLYGNENNELQSLNKFDDPKEVDYINDNKNEVFIQTQIQNADDDNFLDDEKKESDTLNDSLMQEETATTEEVSNSSSKTNSLSHKESNESIIEDNQVLSKIHTKKDANSSISSTKVVRATVHRQSTLLQKQTISLNPTKQSTKNTIILDEDATIAKKVSLLEKKFQKEREAIHAANAKEIAILTRKLNITETQIHEANKIIQTLRNELEQIRIQAPKVFILEKEVDSLRITNKELTETITIANEENMLAKKKIEELDHLYKNESLQRKKYYNIIEEMKGKVRVFARIRPMSTTEISRCNNICIKRIDDVTAEITLRDRGIKQFIFDRIFDISSKQDDIFTDCQNLVQSAFDGYNVAIFACMINSILYCHIINIYICFFFLYLLTERSYILHNIIFFFFL